MHTSEGEKTKIAQLQRRGSLLRRQATKAELLIEQSNFHRIRNHEAIEKIKEEALNKKRSILLASKMDPSAPLAVEEEDLSPMARSG